MASTTAQDVPRFSSRDVSYATDWARVAGGWHVAKQDHSIVLINPAAGDNLSIELMPLSTGCLMRKTWTDSMGRRMTCARIIPSVQEALTGVHNPDKVGALLKALARRSAQ